MALDTLQYFFQRVPRLEYVSPPICEVEFSSSAFPTIILNPNSRRLGPTGFEFFVQDGRIFLRWNNYPGAICFSVYKAVDELDPFGDFVLVAECVQSPFEITDPGTYRISGITLDGETLFSEIVVVPAEPPGFTACIETPGPPAPFGLTPFEIDADVAWPETPVVFPWANETFNHVSQTLAEDYPPGHYDVEYISGVFQFSSTSYEVHLSSLTDNLQPGPFTLDGNTIAGSTYVVETQIDDPNNTGFSTIAPDPAAAEAIMQAHFNTPGVTRRFKHRQLHENLGGPIKFKFQYGGSPFPTILDLIYQLIQIDGLIQQPRGVRIASWAVVQSSFPGEVFNNWNGELPVRSEYTQTTCVHTAAASGPFGGATLSFITNHPTSATGTGWELRVFVGATLIWIGRKQYDETGLGDYFRAPESPTLTPLCLNIEEIP